jgi:DNA recombination protein RmuC
MNNIPYEYHIALAILLAFILGAMLAWLIIRPRITEAQKRLSDTEGERNELDKQLAVAEQRAERIPIIEKEVEGFQNELKQLSSALAKETEKTVQMHELEKTIKEKEQNLDSLRIESANQKATIAELNTRIEAERSQSEEKLALLNEAKTELTNQFKTLAQDIFEEKGKTFSEQNQIKLDAVLNPFRDQLKDFKQKVDDVYVSEAKERASLKQELENLRRLNQQINQEAMNLTRALKGDQKALGTWGEMILERVLEQSGLRKGVEYETQSGFRDADNKLLKPDVIIRLPEGRDVIVDSKVSLSDYEKYSSTEDETEQMEALKAHVQAVRIHIDSLSSKDYSSLKGLRSLDYVFMFMPIEAAFMAAFQHDETLFSDAFERKIVVVTPTTLLATLRTIESIWRYERQNQNAQVIAQQAGSVYNKLRGFVDDMEKLGKQLRTAQGSYEDAMDKLKRGRGNLISQANRFVGLGVKVKKVLPKSITESAEIDTENDTETTDSESTESDTS